MKALVVDDSRAMRLLLSQMLKGLGFEVSEAKHGREAIEFLRAHPDTNLALIDWNMPEMNGLELVQAVAAEGTLGSLRMMMVTTETEMSQMAAALGAGAHEYVMKPFTKSVIEEKLRILGLAA